MRIIGPNCLGIIVPGLSLNASFATGMPKTGRVAFVSQSGALCTSVLDWALEENIGFSYFVSIGNTLDVDFGDLIDYFGEDPQTDSVLLYIESLRDARHFMTATRAFARSKPIVAYKAGRFAESARAAASHTGALAGEDDVYQAAFDRAGIARVYDIGAIFDCAELVARYEPPRGARLAIVTNAGGPGVMATDALIARRGVLAELAPATVEALNRRFRPSGRTATDRRAGCALEAIARRAARARGPRRRGARHPDAEAMTAPTYRQGDRRARGARWQADPGCGRRAEHAGHRDLNQAGVATCDAGRSSRRLHDCWSPTRATSILFETPATSR
jgi:hypothetical protein